MENPLVSVIIPNYNHARYLKERIDSVLCQDYQNVQVIILDDHSTDDSLDVIGSYAGNPKIAHIEVNERNSGNTFLQWEKGIGMAEGEYIWIAESDDTAEPTFLSRLMAQLVQHPDAVLAYSYSNMIGPDSKVLDWSWDNPKLYHHPGVYEGKAYCTSRMVFNNSVYNASMVVWRKRFYTGIDQSYKQYRHCGDWLFWFEMCRQGKVIEVPEKLNNFRQHPNKVSNDALRTGADFSEMAPIQMHILDSLNATPLQRSVVRGRMTKHARKLLSQDKQRETRRLYPEILGGTWWDTVIYTIDKVTNKSRVQPR